MNDDRCKEDVVLFKQKVIELCKQFDVSIGHEDIHGSFIIHSGFDENNASWFMDAFVEIED